MSASSHQKMHGEHREWKIDGEFWRDEVAVWERETNHLLNELTTVEQAIRGHAQVLRQHAASIRLYEHQFLKHEHNVAAYERQSVPLRLLSRSGVHAEEAEHHASKQSAHDKIKRQHRELMSKWNSMYSTLLSKT
jgi:hypothetical protein